MYVCFKGSCRTIMGVPGTIFEQWEGLRFCSSHWGVFFDRGIHLDGLTDITSDLYIYSQMVSNSSVILPQPRQGSNLHL